MKICRVVFSTNRLEFLIPTLQSHKHCIDFGDHEVHHILIDDYPKDRNNSQMIELAKQFDFNQLILHEENRGLTLTWTQLWEYLATQNFDYIWHHEDDVIFGVPMKIQTMIDFLEEHKQFCQVNLKRNPWYEKELSETPILDSDVVWTDYRYNVRDDFFWSMASLYPTWILKEPIVETEGCNQSEYSIMKYLREKYDMKMAILKNMDGSNMVEHIGVYSQGKRVLEGEPGWEGFKWFNPDKKYNSKTGQLFE